MNNEITLDNEQTARLLNLTRDYSTVSDIITARDLYNASIEQSGGAANEWAHFTALGSLFRIGYILGQRAERARRSNTHTATHTHTHTHRAAEFCEPCRSFIGEGAAA